MRGRRSEAGPQVVFVLGEKEYKTPETVPAFFESALKLAEISGAEGAAGRFFRR